MGLFDSISNAVSSTKKKVTRSVKRVSRGVRKVAKRVAAAPKAVSAGARQAIRGVRDLGHKVDRVAEAGVRAAAHGASELGRTVKKTAVKTVKKVSEAHETVAKTVTKTAKKAVAGAGQGIRNAVSQAADGAKQLGTKLKQGAKGAVDAVKKGHDKLGEALAKPFVNAPEWVKKVGKWAWDNKGEIALWVGTAALLAAVPVTGGASGAVAGGLMAARMGALGVRIAGMGRVGAMAVKGAKGGVHLLKAAKSLGAGTKAAKVVAGGAQKLTAARTALGATKAGKALSATAKPLGYAADAVATVNFGDTAVKFARGEKSGTDLALSAIGMVPLAGRGVNRALKARTMRAEHAAANTVKATLPAIRKEAANAADEVAKIAKVTPSSSHPVTVRSAKEAAEEAAQIGRKARIIEDEAVIKLAPARRAVGAQKQPVAASSTSTTSVAAKPKQSLQQRRIQREQEAPLNVLNRELADMRKRTALAAEKAGVVVKNAPEELTPAAAAARDRLAHVNKVAADAQRQVDHMAGIRRTNQIVEDGVQDASSLASQVSRWSGLYRNVALITTNPEGEQGFTGTDHAVVNSVGNILLELINSK